ncbi:MAG: YbaK/EbsC family protein [Caldimonas sp.]
MSGPVSSLPTALASFLAGKGISAHVTRATEDAATAEDAARLLGVHVSDIVKTMVLTDGVRYVAAVVPGGRRLDRRKVAQALGTGKLRFASADGVNDHTGYPPGGVAPFAFADAAMRVVVDSSLVQRPGREVVAGGGRAELLIRISVDDLVRHNEATVSSIAQDGKAG